LTRNGVTEMSVEKLSRQQRRAQQRAAEKSPTRTFMDYSAEANICTWVAALKGQLDERGYSIPIHSIGDMVREGEGGNGRPEHEIDAMADRIVEELSLRGVKKAIVQMRDGRTEHVIYTTGLRNIPCANGTDRFSWRDEARVSMTQKGSE